MGSKPSIDANPKRDIYGTNKKKTGEQEYIEEEVNTEEEEEEEVLIEEEEEEEEPTMGTTDDNFETGGGWGDMNAMDMMNRSYYLIGGVSLLLFLLFSYNAYCNRSGGKDKTRLMIYLFFMVATLAITVMSFYYGHKENKIME